MLENWNTDQIDVTGIAVLSDGDSFLIGDQKIRLFGVDAFEIGQTCEIRSQAYDCGAASRTALAAMTQAPIRCRGDAFDRYDRLVAVCFAESHEINALLVERGHALADQRFSKNYVDEERQAKRAKAGVWAGDFQAPWTFRAEQ